MLILIPPSERKSKIQSSDTLFENTNFEFKNEVHEIIRTLNAKENQDLLKRVIPIKLVDMEINVNQAGSVYKVSAIPYNEFAFVNRYSYVRSSGTIPAKDTLGNTIPYAGWWFYNIEGAFWPWLDGNPGNNWGDGANDVGHGPWMFCWEITTSTCPPSANGASLAMKILTHSDYEMGSWFWPGCYSDPVYLFNATMDCCPTIYTSNITHY